MDKMLNLMTIPFHQLALEDSPVFAVRTASEHSSRFFWGQPEAQLMGYELNGLGWNRWSDAPQEKYCLGTFHTYNLMVLEAGEIDLQIDGATFRMEAGLAYLFRPGQSRFFLAMQPGTVERWISMSGPWLQTQDSALPRGMFSLAAIMEDLKGWMGSIGHGGQEEFSLSALRQLTLDSLHFLLRIVQGHPTHLSKRPLDALDQLIEQIRTEPSFDWNPRVMARELAMSYASFRTKMTQRTGHPPSTFIRHVRMNQACTLLLQGHSVKSACLGIGMNDPYHFSRLFKAIVGKAPSEFAK
jgi:AraC-like DNA-binding protein